MILILRVIVTMSPSYGGPCQGIRNSIPALQKLGVSNEVLCFDEPDSDYGVKDCFTIHKIGAGKGSYSYNSKLKEWLAGNLGRFDFVIVHGLWLHTSYGVYRAWSRYKHINSSCPSLFVMPHGMLDPYFQKAKERRFKAFRNSVFWHLFEKRVINGVDGLLFTCQMELELAREAFWDYHPKREVNVGYGIQAPPSFDPDMEFAFRSKTGLKKDDRYFLFLSRIHEKKGVDLLIRAYIDLADGGSVSGIPKLVIAGPLSGGFAKSMQELVGKREDIIFTGMLQSDAKWGALYLSEAFILPSHQENFGIAVVEAMACGSPVLISDKINIWKEIDKGKGGLVESDSAEGAHNLLVRWTALSDSERSKYRKAARKTYEHYFTVEQAAVQFSKQLGFGDF